jgi:hypothetical protein
MKGLPEIILLKEKDKDPIQFNSFKKLSEYWKVSPATARRYYYTIKKAERIIQQFTIEKLEQAMKIIPNKLMDDGFKVIELGTNYTFMANKDGIIINASTKKVRKPYLDKKTGYYYIRLGYNNFLLHRIIASLFVPNPNNYPIVNHINEDKTDNRAENLEWCSYKYNSNFGNIKDKLSCVGKKEKVAIICSDGKKELIFKSIHSASVELGINANSIRNCLKGYKKQAKGYTFSYVEFAPDMNFVSNKKTHRQPVTVGKSIKS